MLERLVVDLCTSRCRRRRAHYRQTQQQQQQHAAPPTLVKLPIPLPSSICPTLHPFCPALPLQKMEQYLGCTPDSDAQGVLQDVHWSAGLFGYFPTYSLGAMYACQIFQVGVNNRPSTVNEDHSEHSLGQHYRAY
jgi:hypothetical protein